MAMFSPKCCKNSIHINIHIHHQYLSELSENLSKDINQPTVD